MDLFTLFGKISIESGNANDEMDNMIDKAETLQSTLNSTSSSSDAAGKTIVNSATQAATGTGKAVSSIQVALGNLATQAANKAYSIGKSFIKTGFERNQNWEKWTASIKTYMGGDVEAANALMEEIQQFAVDTPLSLSDSVQSAVRLMASGIDGENVVDMLAMLGDVANGDTEKLSRLALVDSQVITSGKLSGNDPIQFKEAGVPIYDLLEQYYAAQGIKHGDLMELQKAGGITAEHVQGALFMSTQPGGLYYNAMNNIMDTEYGREQKLKDAYDQMAGNVMKDLFNTISTETIPALEETVTELDDWANKNSGSVGKAAEGVSDMATSLANIGAKTLTTLTDFFSGGGTGDPIASASMLTGLGLTTSGLLTGNVKHGLSGGGLMLTATATSVNQMVDAFKEQGIDDINEAFGTAQTNLEKQSTLLHYMTKTGAFAEKKEDKAEYLREPSWYEKAMLGVAGAFGLDETKHKMEEAWGLTEKETPDEEEANIGGSLKQLNENMHNMSMMFASANGMPERKNEGMGRDSWIGDTLRGVLSGADLTRGMGATPYEQVDNAANTSAIVSALSGIQSALAALPAQVEAGASAGAAAGCAAGVGGISVTGTITTGNVTLNGSVVGTLAPKLDLALGSLYRRAARM